MCLISSVLQNNDFKELIWTGDINADFSRATKFVQILRHFVEENDLTKAWERFEVDFTHTNDVDNITHVSTIDHFFWNKSLDSNIIEADVLHLPGNLSDHSPIYCTIADNVITMQNKQNHNSEPKPNWKIATEQDKNEFFNEINVQLNKVAVPDVVQNCKDVQCNHAQHRYESDVYMLDILHEIEQAALRKLPIPRNKTSDNISMKAIPRWKEDIAPYKDNAVFWNSVWNSTGKPHNTELHNIMKRTRNLYYFHIRKNKRMLAG